MPTKSDDKRRWVEVEVLLPGTPEQIWNAIATGAGMTAWFTPTTVDEREGGAVTFDFGDGMSSKGVVTGWHPPTHLTYEEHAWNGEAPPVVTEVTVVGRAGNKSVLRMVHSLFTTLDTWDDEIEGFEAGWPGFFAVLKVYLTRFPGAKAATARSTKVHAGDQGDAWQRLAVGLGLAGAEVGERRAAPAGAPQLAGVVERIRQDEAAREIMLRIDQPAPGIALIGSYATAGTVRAAACFYFYGEGAASSAKDFDPALHRWMGAQFPG